MHVTKHTFVVIINVGWGEIKSCWWLWMTRILWVVHIKGGFARKACAGKAFAGRAIAWRAIAGRTFAWRTIAGRAIAGRTVHGGLLQGGLLQGGLLQEGLCICREGIESSLQRRFLQEFFISTAGSSKLRISDRALKGRLNSSVHQRPRANPQLHKPRYIF